MSDKERALLRDIARWKSITSLPHKIEKFGSLAAFDQWNADLWKRFNAALDAPVAELCQQCKGAGCQRCKFTCTEPSAQELSDEVIEAIGHRKAWRYKYSSDPHHSSTYTFNRACLIEFGRAILAAKAQGGSHG